MTRRTASWIVVVLLAVIGLLPVLSMVFSTFHTEAGFSFEGYRQMLHTPSLWQSFGNSLLLAFTVASAATLAGTFLGILLEKTTLYFRKIWLALLLIPLLIPPYILAYGWYMLVGREGAWGEILFGFWGTACILFSVYLPIAILITSVSLRTIDPRFEEAGLLVCPWRCVLSKITLVLMLPSAMVSFLLIFILSMGEFSVANFLRYDIFPMESFIQFSAFYDFRTATLYAMPLLAIVLVILGIESLLFKKGALRFKSRTERLTIPLHALQIPFLVLIGTFILIIIGMPLYGLMHSIDAQSFIHALHKAAPALGQSLLYALLSALLLVFFGFATAYIIVYRTIKGWRVLDAMNLFWFILPATVIGIALILFWNRPYTNIIYASPLIILFGYLVKYLFLSSKIIELRLSQIPRSFMEAAQLTGASWYQILLYILLPLSSGSLAAAGMIGFVFSLRESTLTMLVAPAGTATLPVYIFTQMANGSEATVASLCLIMLLIVILPLLGLSGYTAYQGKKYDHA